MKSNFSLKTLMMIFAITTVSLVLHAQPGGPPGGGGTTDPDPGPNTSVPFDGGLSILLAAGAGFAIKKARDKRKAIEKEKMV